MNTTTRANAAHKGAQGQVNAQFSGVVRFSVPWPPPQLGPNSRADRRRITSLRRSATILGWSAVRENLGRDGLPAIKALFNGQPLSVVMIFHPPRGQVAGDLDNLVARMKSTVDGAFSALGVDDAQVTELLGLKAGSHEAGCVAISITPAFSIEPESS